MILSGHAIWFAKPVRPAEILLRFVDEPAESYFKRNSMQASAFKNIVFDCKLGWKTGQTEMARMKKWNVYFVAEQLALLLVLHRQAKKVKNEKVEQQRTLRLESVSASVGSVPKNNALKHAFSKLWSIRSSSRIMSWPKRTERENATYHSPSHQDLVPWGSWTKCPMNCPSCFHALMLL